MRTALFVYQLTDIEISTSETDLEFEGMEVAAVPLSAGTNTLTVSPGVYRIDSSCKLGIKDSESKFDQVEARKNNTPAVTAPSRVATFLGSLDETAMQAFLAEPSAKQAVNP